MQELNKALFAFKKLQVTVSKDKTNSHYKTKHTDINGVIASTREPLIECGLMFTHTVNDGILTTELIHVESGETKVSTTIVPDGLSAQALGSFITYNRRYNEVMILDLEQEDDDGEVAMGRKPIAMANQAQLGQISSIIERNSEITVDQVLLNNNVQELENLTQQMAQNTIRDLLAFEGSKQMVQPPKQVTAPAVDAYKGGKGA